MPAPATASTDGQLLELFSSIQGEGLLVGCRQIFLRLAGCNLDCAYCDTPFAATANCRVEESPGGGQFISLPNPVALDTLIRIIHSWCRQPSGVHHSISLTGGEPLAQAALLADWLPVLRKLLPTYLETNGTLPQALEPLLPHLDWIAMDIKLASLSGVATPWATHREFLRLAATRDCFVKAVVGEETPLAEVTEAAQLVAGVAPQCELILQPVTREGKPMLTPRQLLDLQGAAARHHPRVRIIPQTHRFIGLL
ncbi:7-cyano-7-deazaguanine synthase [Desulfuromonas sp. DDH964]|uniref:7-carboxy-7-deazaguanine synthase QueE n=1 Tax=Desulfuromonas sp. DDH964 TaxID=1823759 RepID=UPI00078BEFF2|nr:7-carboxy-7-deazaguanine synthase QueE [Desulfuromonas sp. DDH964]AMV72309.1 7-cyano-7-deazaguanine synthase [Desulfuromonas sp. DDH964]